MIFEIIELEIKIWEVRETEDFKSNGGCQLKKEIFILADYFTQWLYKLSFFIWLPNS